VQGFSVIVNLRVLNASLNSDVYSSSDHLMFDHAVRRHRQSATACGGMGLGIW
jgi:hypothetical protein